MAPPNDADAGLLWDARYEGANGYLYGTAPNDFVAQVTAGLTPGDTLCLADGEGRNGVYLASRGHRVTSVDISRHGMDKAVQLATERGVEITPVVADLAHFDLGRERWDLIVSVFAHTAPAVRARLHGAIASALRPGGLFVLEAYTPDQIGRGTGGPPIPELTMNLDDLRQELDGLSIEHGVELVRPVLEGTGHTGAGAVVQVMARKVKPSA